MRNKIISLLMLSLILSACGKAPKNIDTKEEKSVSIQSEQSNNSKSVISEIDDDKSDTEEIEENEEETKEVIKTWTFKKDKKEYKYVSGLDWDSKKNEIKKYSNITNLFNNLKTVIKTEDGIEPTVANYIMNNFIGYENVTDDFMQKDSLNDGLNEDSICTLNMLSFSDNYIDKTITIYTLKNGQIFQINIGRLFNDDELVTIKKAIQKYLNVNIDNPDDKWIPLSSRTVRLKIKADEIDFTSASQIYDDYVKKSIRKYNIFTNKNKFIDYVINNKFTIASYTLSDNDYGNLYNMPTLFFDSGTKDNTIETTILISDTGKLYLTVKGYAEDDTKFVNDLSYIFDDKIVKGIKKQVEECKSKIEQTIIKKYKLKNSILYVSLTYENGTLFIKEMKVLP